MNYKGVLNEYLTNGMFSDVYYSQSVFGRDECPYYKSLCTVVFKDQTIFEESSVFSRKISSEQDAAKRIVKRFNLEITNIRGGLIEAVQSVHSKARVGFGEKSVSIEFPESSIVFHREEFRNEEELVDAALNRLEKLKITRKRPREKSRKVLVVVDAENVPVSSDKLVVDEDVVYALFCRKTHPMARVKFDEKYNITKRVLDIKSEFKDAADVHIAMFLSRIETTIYDDVYLVTKDNIGKTIAEVLRLMKGAKIQVVPDLPDLN